MTTPLAPDAAWRILHADATAPYRAAGRFGWHFARGKLGHDPVFRQILAQGLARPGARWVLDIGCGQGLLASLLHSADTLQSGGRWPAEWPPAPRSTRYTGIELMPRDVERAERGIGRLPSAPRFVCGDMCRTDLPASDLVVILDVLHYVDHAAQRAVLGRVHAALQPGGRLLLRVGDAAQRRGFAVSQWVDRTVTRIRGHRVSPTWGRTLDAWAALLGEIGFSVRRLPMSQGTPFANVLLVADVASAEGAA
ncbi:class I SAM-dependent methyltransferase [uncultured Xylophilus sp.]|uniref:class I SAM-dependent DNA methyltransferase n=1 Tax=uncultured Xylophilus sp. TaxID=296832 RepID=UPI0025D342ED|nr:class I SAM-dependent methyltransferase [uncultured Xylophilus sp.]